MLIATTILFSCSEDDSGNPSNGLTANAGPDQTGAPFTTVTLDGSASTGPNGNSFNYEWIVQGGPESFFLDNSSTANPSFEPTKNGIYQFTLRITNGSEFSEDQVQITVTGAVELSGTLTENTTLKDIDTDSSMPDYLITSDLIIPSGITLTFDDPNNSGNSGVVVKVAEGAGIIIQDGATLRATTSGNHKFTSDTGWKGLLVDGGTIDVSVLTTIENAGSAPFDGQSEAAAVTFAGTTPSISAFSQVAFVNSASYDFLVVTPVSGSDAVVSNVTFSNAKPIKAPVSFVNSIGFNTYPAAYDYIHLQPSGGSTIDALPGGQTFLFRAGAKFYLDEDFLAGSPVSMQGVTILMKAGAGILAQSSLSITSSSVLKGLDDAPWKGIAYAGAGEQLVINSSTIDGGGSEVFNTGFFTSLEKAAVYFTNGTANLSGAEITNSGGYGVYNQTAIIPVVIQSCTFTNTAKSAYSGLITDIHSSVQQNNTFTMPAGVAAVEVRVTNPSQTPISTWRSLGGSNYYLFSGNVKQSGGSWTLSPGVNLKFKAGKTLALEQGSFVAKGSALEPITFDGEAGTVGSWAGIHVQTLTKFEFCQIKNGGEVLIQKNGVTPATEKANVVFDYGGGSTANTFKNNTVSGSGGYGALVEAGKQDPDALNVANNNTFSIDNVSGNVIVK